MSKTTEIFCRLPKSVELIQDFKDITPSPKANAECRAALYSKMVIFLLIPNHKK